MNISSVMSCSFPSWYKHFKRVTTESIIIPLPEIFLKYLHTDGLVLPESSTHGLYEKASNMAMDGDDNDADIRDDELMKMYEDDWSTPSDIPVAQAPEFGEFEQTVKSAIVSLGGRVFPKLNWSSPKDAHWIAFDRTLMCTCSSDIYLLLKSSQFIAHDLDQPFTHCEDWTPEQGKSPSVNYCLVLRKWQPPEPSSEFRCFVYNKRIIAVCQRNCSKFYPYIQEDRTVIMEDIQSFFKNKIVGAFPESNYIFDVTRPKEGKVSLVDFNPFGRVTDGLMFTWQDLDKLAIKSGVVSDMQPCFRCVETEAGVQVLTHANYSFPQDIQDLTRGEDPQKFIDLMNLKIQRDGETDSSDDGDDGGVDNARCTNETGVKSNSSPLDVDVQNSTPSSQDVNQSSCGKSSSEETR